MKDTDQFLATGKVVDFKKEKRILGAFPGCPASGGFPLASIFSSPAPERKICVSHPTKLQMADPKIIFPSLLHPLSMMRRARGLPSLEFKEIESHELPQPYRQLLAHEGDMTSRLENAYRSSIRVNRLSSSNDGKKLFQGGYS